MKFVPSHHSSGETSVFYWQEHPNKIQQGRKSGKWLKVEITAVKGPKIVISAGASNFQVNASKLSTTFGQCGSGKNFRIRVSVQDHLCCGFLVKVDQMSGSCSLTTLFLSAFLDPPTTPLEQS